MKAKLVLFVSVALLILLTLSGCRRLKQTASSVPQTSGISMIPETSQQSTDSMSMTTAVSQTENSPETAPADSKETDETLDQILRELEGLDSVYSQMDTVSDSDLSN